MRPRSRSQRGVFFIITALALPVIFGVVGLAIDSGRQQVVRAELQNSADACALSAVMELNGSDVAPQRATLAGIFVGANRNLKNFQNEQVAIAPADITFGTSLNGAFVEASAASSATNYTFVRCIVREPSLINYFMSVLNLGDSALSAMAVATLQPGQSFCSMPMSICSGTPTAGLANNFGYSRGQRITMGGTSFTGFFTFADVSGSGITSASGLIPFFNTTGQCDIPPVTSACIGAPSTSNCRCIDVAPGAKTSLEVNWNARFGVYKSDDPLAAAQAPPDRVGWGYTTATLGTSAISDYEMRSTVAFQGSIAGGYDIPSPIASHQTHGITNRRRVSLPVVQCPADSSGVNLCGVSSKRLVIGWACVLMAKPISPNEDAAVIYLGSADDPANGCISTGLAGGGNTTGPLVPVLVQ